MRRTTPFLLALPLLLAACGSDTTDTPVSPGRVTLRISALWPRGGDPWWPPYAAPDDESSYPGDPEPVVVGCDKRLAVSVALDNFYLRAPDACGASTQCGFLSLEVDPDLSQASSVIERAPAHARGAADTLSLDLSALEPVEGDHLIHAALFTAAAHEFKGPFTAPPEDLAVSLAFEDCPLGGTGGMGGSAGGGSGGIANPGGASGSGGTNGGSSGSSGAAGESGNAGQPNDGGASGQSGAPSDSGSSGAPP